MIRGNSRDLLLLSLRALTRFTKGVEPSRRDLIILRRNAAPGEAALPVDELCCAVIRRELEFSGDQLLELAS